MCGEREEGEEGTGGQRKRKEGLRGEEGAEVLRHAIVSDRPCVSGPGFHCVGGSPAFPNQFSSVLNFG